MTSKEKQKLIKKSLNYGKKESEMTLQQIKDKYFPNRNLNDLRGVIKKENPIMDKINEIIKEKKNEDLY